MKEEPSKYMLICSNCKTKRESGSKAAVCLVCGNIAKMPPLTDGAFEAIKEGDEPEKPKKQGKPVDTTHRAPEDGGRTM